MNDIKKKIMDHLISLKIKKDDNILVYSNFSSFGLIGKKFVKKFVILLVEYIGVKGTIIMPSYSFSSSKNFIFDPKKLANTSTTSLIVKEFFKFKNIKRSLRPIHSHIGIGPKSTFLKNKKTFDSFGKNSDFHFLKKYNFKSIYLGCSPNEAATFLTNLEYISNVPYRNKIVIKKKIRNNNTYRLVKLNYFDKPCNIKFNFNHAFDEMEKMGLKINKSFLKFGTSISFKNRDLYYYGMKILKKNKYCFVEKINNDKKRCN